jgi:hypothetical protein
MGMFTVLSFTGSSEIAGSPNQFRELPEDSTPQLLVTFRKLRNSAINL